MYPRLFSQYFSTVYTFEPDPLNFHCLAANCSVPNIIKIQGAVGEDRAPISMHRLTDTNVGMHRVLQGGNIPQFKIDDLCLETCDLIQLDIEGYEIHALRGAAGTINRHRPTIVVENDNQMITDFLAQYDIHKVDTSFMDTIYVAK